MRAHFAGDVVSPTGNCTSGIGDAVAAAPTAAKSKTTAMDTSTNADHELQARIAEFKQDSKNMEALHEFIDEVLLNAETEALKKQQQARETSKNIAQPKEKSRQSFAIPDFKNGKVVNRARGLVVRLFDAICNCANTAAAPAQRIKLRGKRAASTTNGSGSGSGGGGGGGGSNSGVAHGGDGSGAGATSGGIADTAFGSGGGGGGGGGSKKQDNGKDRKDNEKKKKKDNAEEQPLMQQQQQQHNAAVAAPAAANK